MFEIPFRAKVKRVEVFAMELDDQTFRRIRMTLEREYDNEIASGLGPNAKDALDHVSDGGFSQVVLPIDAVQAEIELKGANAKITVKQASGIKATITAPKPGKKTEDDETADEPSIRMVFVAPFLEDSWTFLGRHALDIVEVTMHKVQFELPLAHPPKIPRGPTGNGSGDPKAGAELADSLKAAGKKGRGKQKAEKALERAIDAVAEEQRGSTPDQPLAF